GVPVLFGWTYAGRVVAHTLQPMTSDTPDETNPSPPPTRLGKGPVVASDTDEQSLHTSQLGSGGLAQQTSESQPAIAVLKVCPHCGTEYETAARFCPADGTALRPKGSDSLIGSVLAERYHILKRIGEGGMGRVYLGEHVKMNRQCAVKVMSPSLVNDAESASRFAREASSAARIIHPNVAAVFDYGESEGLVYLVMEYVDGEPLSRLLAREAPFALERAVDIARQIADGLGAAHELGIVHRDLKPDNILVTRTRSGREVAKVVDFGIAKAMQEGAGEALTRTGLVIGTPEFMSPEQLLGDPIDARSDLYALGCILHLMLTAAPAFDAPTREQMIKRRLSENPPHAQELDPGIPDAIDRVIVKLLARTPDERYGSAAEVRDALSGAHTRRLSSDGSVLPRKETPRSAQTIVFGAAGTDEATAARAAARAAVLKTPRRGPTAPASKRRIWPWVLGVVAIVAIAWSMLAKSSRLGQEARYARARVDSTRRADSTRKVDSARADSVSNAALVGGMVDTSKLAEQAKKDSVANAQRALNSAVATGIRAYTNAIQRGDLAEARVAFPRVDEAELTRWQSALEKYDIRIRVDAPRSVQLSGGVVADADVTLVVEYIDRTTKAPVSTNRLPRHATLTKQGSRWQLDALKPR
ncbi:MAG TPA: serine/threonine-protein kinase, partial [Gemmatimonadaceae bacterium]|nr:serine/threonine-protein kinase [Gemmatimonadaceae bacterium]